jgi:predicted nucleotidyltransferase
LWYINHKLYSFYIHKNLAVGVGSPFFQTIKKLRFASFNDSPNSYIPNRPLTNGGSGREALVAMASTPRHSSPGWGAKIETARVRFFFVTQFEGPAFNIVRGTRYKLLSGKFKLGSQKQPNLISVRFNYICKKGRIMLSTRAHNKSDIREALSESTLTLDRFGVRSIGLFGSFVRNEVQEESDVDLLVDFQAGKKSFDNFMELAFYLEDLFGRKVEIVTPQSLSKHIGPHILKEVELVYQS